VTTAGFSVLEGGSHIAAHADPNSGALRVQVPITVPGRPGECRIAIEDDVVAWEVGRGVLFDVTAPHEVWNDTAEDRILLLVETPMPLPFPLGAINGLVQRLFRFHPSHQAMARRVRAFAEA
jgi:beta-hydroxylase